MKAICPVDKVLGQNVAVCPKTFSNRFDSHYQWYTGDTSSYILCISCL